MGNRNQQRRDLATEELRQLKDDIARLYSGAVEAAKAVVKVGKPVGTKGGGRPPKNKGPEKVQAINLPTPPRQRDQDGRVAAVAGKALGLKRDDMECIAYIDKRVHLPGVQAIADKVARTGEAKAMDGALLPSTAKARVENIERDLELKAKPVTTVKPKAPKPTPAPTNVHTPSLTVVADIDEEALRIAKRLAVNL